MRDCWKEMQYANVLERKNKEQSWYQTVTKRSEMVVVIKYPQDIE